MLLVSSGSAGSPSHFLRKHWQIRGKFQSIPIPGESVNLNADALLSQAQAEQEALRTELKEIMDQLTYVEMAKQDSEKSEAVNTVQKRVPNLIFQG